MNRQGMNLDYNYIAPDVRGDGKPEGDYYEISSIKTTLNLIGLGVLSNDESVGPAIANAAKLADGTHDDQQQALKVTVSGVVFDVVLSWFEGAVFSEWTVLSLTTDQNFIEAIDHDQIAEWIADDFEHDYPVCLKLSDITADVSLTASAA